MKIYKSNIFGKIPQPESFKELIDLITEIEIDKYFPDYKFIPVKMWRGQSNIDWKIDSSAFRRIQLQSKNTNSDLRSYEKNLLELAAHKGYKYQNGRELSDLELLAKLQHHGTATRLVDFSKNALIGLWFCINYNTSKTGILIGIHSLHVGGMEGMINKQNYNEIVNTCEKLEHPMLWESPHNSPRISSQHALFLYSGISTEKTGSLQLPKGKDGKLFIAISPEVKEMCIPILENIFDLRLITLFPDLDGFGMANNFDVNPNAMHRW